MMCMFLAACGSFGSLAPFPLTFSPTKVFFAFFATGEDMFGFDVWRLSHPATLEMRLWV